MNAYTLKDAAPHTSSLSPSIILHPAICITHPLRLRAYLSLQSPRSTVLLLDIVSTTPTYQYLPTFGCVDSSNCRPGSIHAQAHLLQSLPSPFPFPASSIQLYLAFIVTHHSCVGGGDFAADERFALGSRQQISVQVYICMISGILLPSSGMQVMREALFVYQQCYLHTVFPVPGSGFGIAVHFSVVVLKMIDDHCCYQERDLCYLPVQMH
jgi:hypothetical protein